jgi:NSS family neurotransmitter:Na+ symporter
VVSYFVDERRWSRKKSVWAVGLATFVIGLPSALSQGAVEKLSAFSIFGQTDFLSLMDFIWGNISLALGALLLSVFVGWVWGAASAGIEFRRGSFMGETAVKVWSVFIQYVCPVVIFIVLLNVFGVF